MTRFPGALTTSFSAWAAIERLSFPPSIAMPSSIIASDKATAASYMSVPSPSSLAAYIQLPLALTSEREVTCAHTRFVNASPTANRAIALGSNRPLIGCSPMAQAPPVKSLKV
ncbi:hypothetical protein V8G54_006907 [Vigna mungo]|uniref:Uncharacterized protein n=1 Tax=Vigna mungo TaxID=3915 RepID=A0AAQ3P2C3_VIGMU